MITTKTFGNYREAGLLLPIFSLPSRFGIGDFGEEAYHFVDLLVQAKQSYWQILPLNPLGYGNSPYQSLSSFAGDEIYISLSLLVKDKLIDSVPDFYKDTHFISYDRVREFKNHYLYKAFLNFKENDDYHKFIKEAFWLKDYALFKARKLKNENKSWNKWTELDIDEESIRYQYFLQYYFYKQWMNLKAYANKKGIKVIGDLPIYVGYDSSDVYDHKEVFLLDENNNPTSVAGVPPDYFSEDGQLWGNPLYNWDYLKKTDYHFWIQRLSWNQRLYDIIRIDHFRAFDTYWKIPYGETTARNGEWVLGPSYDFFDSLYKQLPHIQLIAEDLGNLRYEVLELKNHYHLLGMSVGQFLFGDSKSNYHLPINTIGYTGTHDNAPLKGWLKSLSKEDKKRLKSIFRKMSIYEKNLNLKILHYILKENENIAIILLQDYLELDEKARINTPSTIGYPNWCYKLLSFDALEKKISYISGLMEKYHRLPQNVVK